MENKEAPVVLPDELKNHLYDIAKELSEIALEYGLELGINGCCHDKTKAYGSLAVYESGFARNLLCEQTPFIYKSERITAQHK